MSAEPETEVVVEFAIGENFVVCPFLNGNGTPCKASAQAIENSVVTCPKGHKYVTRLNTDLPSSKVRPSVVKIDSDSRGAAVLPPSSIMSILQARRP